jgi:NADH-quinone oxidoreductase subunit G
LVPAYQIFGSDELSARSAPIQQRMTDAYVSIAPEEASKLSLQQGDRVSLNGDAGVATVCIRARMKAGTAALYCGDNEINAFALGSSVTLSKTGDSNGMRGIQGLIVSDLYEEDY